MDLMASRMTGMTIGPIWWSEIQKYCEAHDLDEYQTEAMHHHIREMDSAYIANFTKKNSS